MAHTPQAPSPAGRGRVAPSSNAALNVSQTRPWHRQNRPFTLQGLDRESLFLVCSPGGPRPSRSARGTGWTVQFRSSHGPRSQARGPGPTRGVVRVPHQGCSNPELGGEAWGPAERGLPPGGQARPAASECRHTHWLSGGQWLMVGAWLAAGLIRQLVAPPGDPVGCNFGAGWGRKLCRLASTCPTGDLAQGSRAHEWSGQGDTPAAGLPCMVLRPR